MNIGDTIAPNSDQLDAIDLLAGPKTFTITKVTKSNGEQPVDVHLAEFPRVWRPGKSMRRVLVALWGPDAAAYAGRRLTLWCDPTVRFGGAEVGGVRITHMSHLDKPGSVPLLITRGKSAVYKVAVLTDDAPAARTVSPETLAELVSTFDRKGVPEDKRLAGVHHYTGGFATALETITEDEARKMLEVLADRPDVAPADSEPQLPDPNAWDNVEVAPIGGKS